MPVSRVSDERVVVRLMLITNQEDIAAMITDTISWRRESKTGEVDE